MPRMTGGQAVVEQLAREGVDVVFGMPGVHTLDIYDALIDSEIQHVTTRHEQGAGFMADGYARSTGRVGVALVITGPGLTNAATAIGQAYSDSSPMLVISSENETNEYGRGKGLLHEMKDQQGVMEHLTAYSRHVDRVADVPDAITEAFEYLASNRPRPVHIQVPTDVLGREDAVSLTERAPASPPPVDDARIDDLADRLANAEAPLLYVGGGASGAAREVRALVDRTGIPVASSVAGKGIVPASHDLNLGATLSRDGLADFVADRDLVLAVGTELTPREAGDSLPANLVQVDIDYRNIGLNHPTALDIVADAGDALRALLDRLDDREVRFGDVDRDRVASVAAPSVDPDGDDADGRHRIIAALREALDDDAVLVNDMTKLCYEASREFPAEEPDTFLFPRGYGTLGFSPPTAYGAAVGLRETGRQVVALVGDGGFLFTVQDLATAVKYDLSVPVVVLNDECYGVVHDTQIRDYDRAIGTDIENPSFTELAAAFGAAAERIDPDAVETELPAALAAAFERDGPTVVEIPVDF